MTELSNTPNENQDVIETVQISAGEAQRQPQQRARAAAAAPTVLSPAELEERQERIGQTRRSGPPLAAAATPRALAAAAPTEEVEPTEVAEP